MYKVIISGKDVCVDMWETGEQAKRVSIGFDAEGIIDKKDITRKDVLAKVCELTHSNLSLYTEESLFDGNETYFLFNRTEDAEGDEVTNKEHRQMKKAWSATYTIYIEKVERIDAKDILPENIPYRFLIDNEVTETVLNMNYKVGELVLFNGNFYTVEGFERKGNTDEPYMEIKLKEEK